MNYETKNIPFNDMYHCNFIFKDNNTVQLHGYIMYGTKDRCKVVLYTILQYDRN